ncbi:copper chaperone PCu(A)C [Blastococcus sp. CT_GayMR20]|uniref:copper chaperone PCu(A)C n=1 Tax=Blastococcus sp. CT_GayMR20 TaxID=2559609 RepID=UPI00107479F4|nr:copper chaperone PCu(A)C [Blastococcus sp. CT_GayMR20]TFV71544.1 copper chaperone PCu(A)C [Blastococcus sp. CT_GayMR20]
MNRALRAATMGVLLLSPVALTACSAGQVTQTATQERDKTGGMAQVGDLTLRQVVLENPRSGIYEDGDDAELRMAIVNSSQEDDTLVGIEGEGFGDAEIRTSGASGASTGRGSGDEIEIPADTTVFVGEDDATITLTDLEESLTTGQYLDLTLTFENAGEIDVQVTVANPEEAEERGEAFDFHHEEEGETSGETARENESADSE